MWSQSFSLPRQPFFTKAGKRILVLQQMASDIIIIQPRCVKLAIDDSFCFDQLVGWKKKSKLIPLATHVRWVEEFSPLGILFSDSRTLSCQNTLISSQLTATCWSRKFFQQARSTNVNLILNVCGTGKTTHGLKSRLNWRIFDPSMGSYTVFNWPVSSYESRWLQLEVYSINGVANLG